MKSLGIIGGMGPLATVDLYKKITMLTQAKSDAEHVHVYIDSNTAIPDRTRAILYGGESPLPQIISSAQKLESIGADFLVMPCNTSHYYYSQIQQSVSIPLLNMVEECAKEAAALGYSSVGLLATEAVSKTGIYEAAFEKYNIQCLLPTEEEQRHVSSLIYDCVKAGNYNYNLTAFTQVLESLRSRGAKAMQLACTEIPIAFETFSIPGPALDSTLILAKSAIRYAGYSVKED